MYNLSEGIATLRDAETIVASKLLTNEDKALLVNELVANTPPDLGRPYVTTLTAALERLHGTLVPANPARKATGKQDATVVSPPVGAVAEAPAKGPTEGKPEQAENGGSVARPITQRPAAPTASAAKASKPKAG